MFLAKILAISLGVAGVFLAKVVVSPSASAGMPAYLLQQATTTDTVEPQAIMRASSRELPSENWIGH